MSLITQNNNKMLKDTSLTQLGGKKHKKFVSKKKNGHKDNCKCPICINMKHAKTGGAGFKGDYKDEEEEKMDEDKDLINDEDNNDDETNDDEMNDDETNKNNLDTIEDNNVDEVNVETNEDDEYDNNNEDEGLNSEVEDMSGGKKRPHKKHVGGDYQQTVLNDNTTMANDNDYNEIDKMGGSRKKHRHHKGCKTKKGGRRRKHRKTHKKRKNHKKYKTYKRSNKIN